MKPFHIVAAFLWRGYVIGFTESDVWVMPVARTKAVDGLFDNSKTFSSPPHPCPLPQWGRGS
jgi:hypothetical protein